MRKLHLLDILHPTSFFLWFYLFYIGFALFLNIFLKNISFINLEVSNETIFIVILYPIIFLFSSYMLSVLITMKKPKKIKLNLVNDLNNKKVFYIGILFFAVGLFLFTLTYLKIGFIPMFMENVDSGRVEAKAGLGKFILLGTAFLYVSMIFMFAYYNTYNKVKKISIIILLFISCMFIAGIGFRGPVAYLLLYVLLIKFFLSDEYKIKTRIPYRYFIYGIILILMLSVVDYVRHGNQFTIDSFAQIYWTMTVNLYNLNNIVTYFNFHDYHYGKSFIDDFLVAFPGSGTKFFGVVLKNELSLDFAGEGMTVTAPGEGYANGGIIGVVLHAIIFGLMFGLVYEYFCRKNSISSRILMLIIVISFSKVVVGGFMPMFIFTLTPTLIVSLLFIYLVKEKNENTFLRKA